jgi:hypothetical protein
MTKSNLAHAVTEPTRLESARAALKAVRARRVAIDVQVATVESGAAPSAAAAGAAQSLRQQRTGILARMLKLGRVDTAAPDVVAIDRKLIDAEQTERQSAAVAAARAEVLADLEAQVRAVNEQIPAAHRELLLAQFEAAADEIRRDLIPALRDACAALGVAMAKLAGAGVAHCQLAREIRDQHGDFVQALGSESPIHTLDVIALGFGIGDNGGYNNSRIAVRTEIIAAAADALARWRG